MDNVIIIIAIVAFIILLVSLYFVFTKKNNVIEEEIKLAEIDKEIIEVKESLEEIKLEIEEEEIIPEVELEKVLIAPKTEEKEVILARKEIVVKEERKTEVSKTSINIASKTEQNLIKKLDEFEQTKGFLKKEVNLNNLAKQFNTNTKYLSEIIKSYKNKSFNQYLNELRIDYLIEQLKSNDKVLNTKLSYLASDFGFSSHSSFTTIFTQYVNKTPSEFIKDLKEYKK